MKGVTGPNPPETMPSEACFIVKMVAEDSSRTTLAPLPSMAVSLYYWNRKSDISMERGCARELSDGVARDGAIPILLL